MRKGNNDIMNYIGKKLYTRKEAAALLSISTDTLDMLRCAGKLQSYWIGSRVYIKSTDLDRFVATLKAGEPNC